MLSYNQLKVLDQKQGCWKKHNKTQASGAEDILRNEGGRKSKVNIIFCYPEMSHD